MRVRSNTTASSPPLSQQPAGLLAPVEGKPASSASYNAFTAAAGCFACKSESWNPNDAPLIRRFWIDIRSLGTIDTGCSGGNSAACFDFVAMPGLSLQELTNRAPSRLPLRLGMSQKKPTRKKPTIKSPDLPPKKDAKGGRAIHSYSAPLSIPPPGFISPSCQPGGHR